MIVSAFARNVLVEHEMRGVALHLSLAAFGLAGAGFQAASLGQRQLHQLHLLLACESTASLPTNH